MNEPIEAYRGITINEFKNKLIKSKTIINCEKEYTTISSMIDELVDICGVKRQDCEDILITCIKDKLKPMPYMSSASYHEIVLYDNDWGIINESLVWSCWDNAYNSLEKYYKKETWKRGDIIGIVNLEFFGFRNDGKYIWDGDKLIDFDFDNDEFGAIPDTFLVGKEFDSATYWSSTMHNNFIFAQFDRENATDLKILRQDIFSFKYNGVVWLVFSNDTTTLFEKPTLFYNCNELCYNYIKNWLDIDNCNMNNVLVQYIKNE
jgi:hypothetical protein